MPTCHTCHQPLAASPWHYDDQDRGVHWMCPTGTRPEHLYAPLALTEAIHHYLDTPHRRRRHSHRVAHFRKAS